MDFSGEVAEQRNERKINELNEKLGVNYFLFYFILFYL